MYETIYHYYKIYIDNLLTINTRMLVTILYICKSYIFTYIYI